MNDLNVRLLAGAVGAGIFVVFLAALPLFYSGMTDVPGWSVTGFKQGPPGRRRQGRPDRCLCLI